MKCTYYFFLLLGVSFLFCCKSQSGTETASSVNSENQMIERQTVGMASGNRVKAGPPTIVYKTTADFSDYVPVTMNEQRTEIVSYPAPSDIYYKGELAKPTALKNGYLLDNRGINVNVVFLNYTYEEYSQMKSAPSVDEMKKNIKEKYPLRELIDCGVRYQYTNEVDELNALIDANFSGCNRIK